MQTPNELLKELSKPARELFTGILVLYGLVVLYGIGILVAMAMGYRI